MKLKNVVQIAVLGVIGFVLAMGIGMLTGLLGVVSLYVSAGFGAFFVAPVYVIMARKVQKRGASFLFWLIIGLLYIAMGYWIATPICVVAGIIAELIVGDYSNKNRIAMAFSASMFIYAMHPILFVVLLGAENIARFVSSMSLEQAQMMVASYTGNVIVICVLVNIVLELIAGRFGLFINNKFLKRIVNKAGLADEKEISSKEKGGRTAASVYALRAYDSGVLPGLFGNQTVYWTVLVLTLLIALNASTSLFLRQIIVFSVSYGMMYLLTFADLGYVTGIFIGLFALIARFIPIFNIGIVLILTSPSKILACFRKLHMPNTVSVAMIAALRFMDEIGLRLHEIRNGMKIRGFHASLLHPVRTFELYFVPLVYKCLHVSETLVSSIIAKGIEYEGEKTSYYDMRFKFADGISLFVGVALLGVALWTS